MFPFLILHSEAVKVSDEATFIEVSPLTVSLIYIPLVLPFIEPAA